MYTYIIFAILIAFDFDVFYMYGMENKWFIELLCLYYI